MIDLPSNKDRSTPTDLWAGRVVESQDTNFRRSTCFWLWESRDA